MPLLAFVFVFFSMANLGFPGTSSFVGEFLVLAGLFQTNVFAAVAATIGTVLAAAYSVWLCNRILFGPLQTQSIQRFADLNRREVWIFLPLMFLTLWMGFYPHLFLEPLHLPLTFLLQKTAFVL